MGRRRSRHSHPDYRWCVFYLSQEETSRPVIWSAHTTFDLARAGARRLWRRGRGRRGRHLHRVWIRERGTDHKLEIRRP